MLILLTHDLSSAPWEEKKKAKAVMSCTVQHTHNPLHLFIWLMFHWYHPACSHLRNLSRSLWIPSVPALIGFLPFSVKWILLFLLHISLFLLCYLEYLNKQIKFKPLPSVYLQLPVHVTPRLSPRMRYSTTQPLSFAVTYRSIHVIVLWHNLTSVNSELMIMFVKI